MNEATAKLFSVVLADLASRNPDLRWKAAEAIRELGSDAVRRAARPLLACLEDERQARTGRGGMGATRGVAVA